MAFHTPPNVLAAHASRPENAPWMGPMTLVENHDCTPENPDLMPFQRLSPLAFIVPRGSLNAFLMVSNTPPAQDDAVSHADLNFPNSPSPAPLMAPRGSESASLTFFRTPPAHEDAASHAPVNAL